MRAKSTARLIVEKAGLMETVALDFDPNSRQTRFFHK
jgi:hypothetical protein